MEKSVFEQMGGTYRREGDYLLPDLATPESAALGVWGQRHLRYIREHHRDFYVGLQLSGKLNDYLTGIDQQAEEMFLRLVNQMARQEGVTEDLKEADQMSWVGRMNNIRNRVSEFVNQDLICTRNI